MLRFNPTWCFPFDLFMIGSLIAYRLNKWEMFWTLLWIWGFINVILEQCVTLGAELLFYVLMSSYVDCMPSFKASVSGMYACMRRDSERERERGGGGGERARERDGCLYTEDFFLLVWFYPGQCNWLACTDKKRKREWMHESVKSYDFFLNVCNTVY